MNPQAAPCFDGRSDTPNTAYPPVGAEVTVLMRMLNGAPASAPSHSVSGVRIGDAVLLSAEP